MGRMKANALGGWKAGVLEGCWVDFGKVSRVVVSGILEGEVLGSVE